VITESNQKIVSELRALADLLERNEVLNQMWFCNSSALVCRVDTKEELVSAITTAGGKWNKEDAGDSLCVTRHIGAAYVRLFISRDQVCEKRVTKKTVPAKPEMILPAQPERTVDVVEWHCPDSILRPQTVEEQIASLASESSNAAELEATHV
jgi:hypothetical protein